MKNHADRRLRERQELRLRIIDMAREAFISGGEESVTLRGVAEKIEYSPTTIYLHFPNKDALIQELCASEFAAFARVFKQAERVPDPVERLKKTALAYLDFGLQFPAFYRAMFQPSPSRKDPGPQGISEARSGSAQTPNLQAHDFLYAAVFKASAAGCFKPEHRDVAMITQLLWSGLHGIVTLHLVRAKHPNVSWRPVQETAESMVEGLLFGLARQPH